MVKYIFFDLDETLVDNKKAQNMASFYLYNNYKFKEVVSLEEFNKIWDYLADYYYNLYIKKEISFELQRINRIKDLFNKYNICYEQNELEIFNLYLEKYEDNWCLFSDTKSILEKLDNLGYKMGIISNGELNQQIKKLEKTNILSYFSSIITSSEYEFSKPDIRIFDVALQNNNLKYDEIIYIGDNYKNDIMPCLELGIKSFWINRNNDLKNNNIKNEINNLNELISYLDEKEKRYYKNERK